MAQEEPAVSTESGREGYFWEEQDVPLILLLLRTTGAAYSVLVCVQPQNTLISDAQGLDL